MSAENEKLSNCERLRLGRLVFDGADVSALAERYGLAADDVEAAWQFCRQQLSLHLAKASSKDFRLLSDEELRSRSTECLRLLLDWREGLQMQERLAGVAARKDEWTDKQYRPADDAAAQHS